MPRKRIFTEEDPQMDRYHQRQEELEAAGANIYQTSLPTGPTTPNFGPFLASYPQFTQKENMGRYTANCPPEPQSDLQDGRGPKHPPQPYVNLRDLEIPDARNTIGGIENDDYGSRHIARKEKVQQLGVDPEDAENLFRQRDGDDVPRALQVPLAANFNSQSGQAKQAASTIDLTQDDELERDIGQQEQLGAVGGTLRSNGRHPGHDVNAPDLESTQNANLPAVANPDVFNSIGSVEDPNQHAATDDAIDDWCKEFINADAFDTGSTSNSTSNAMMADSKQTNVFEVQRSAMSTTNGLRGPDANESTSNAPAQNMSEIKQDDHTSRSTVHGLSLPQGMQTVENNKRQKKSSYKTEANERLPNPTINQSVQLPGGLLHVFIQQDNSSAPLLLSMEDTKEAFTRPQTDGDDQNSPPRPSRKRAFDNAFSSQQVVQEPVQEPVPVSPPQNRFTLPRDFLGEVWKIAKGHEYGSFERRAYMQALFATYWATLGLVGWAHKDTQARNNIVYVARDLVNAPNCPADAKRWITWGFEHMLQKEQAQLALTVDDVTIDGNANMKGIELVNKKLMVAVTVGEAHAAERKEELLSDIRRIWDIKMGWNTKLDLACMALILFPDEEFTWESEAGNKFMEEDVDYINSLKTEMNPKVVDLTDED